MSASLRGALSHLPHREPDRTLFIYFVPMRHEFSMLMEEAVEGLCKFTYACWSGSVGTSSEIKLQEQQ